MPTPGVDRTTSYGRRVALAALVVSVTLGASACDPPECVQPYVPVAERVVVPGVPPPPDWPATGETQTIDVGFDTDGDGTRDTVDPAVGTRADQVTIHRASGDLVLTGRPQISVGGEPGSARLVAPASFGDIDGDGLTDVVVVTYGDTGAGNGFYIVPGATPAGTHDPATVGIRVLPQAAPTSVASGDLDGDGTAEVVLGLEAGTFTTFIIRGADLAALGPGGAWTTDPPAQIIGPPPITVTGKVLTAVPIASDVRTLALYNGTYDLWVRGGLVRFDPVDGFDGLNPQARIVENADGTKWLLGSDGERNTVREWAWNVSDLCAGARAHPTTTERPTTSAAP